jgi:DNA-binding Lrp family transcriptional regulator
VRPGVELDRFDHTLLAALQEDASATNGVLAERIGLSASQVSRRRQALEEAGVIRGYRALVDREALGLGIVVLVHVTMARHSPENAGRFRRLALARPEVLDAFTLTGEADYVLKVVVADLKGLAAFINDVLLPHEAVDRVRSEVVLEAIKENGALPIPGGEGRR